MRNWILAWWLGACAAPLKIADPSATALIEVDGCTPYLDSYLDGGRVTCNEVAGSEAVCLYETPHDCVTDDKRPGRWVVTLERPRCKDQWRVEAMWCCALEGLPQGVRG